MRFAAESGQHWRERQCISDGFTQLKLCVGLIQNREFVGVESLVAGLQNHRDAGLLFTYPPRQIDTAMLSWRPNVGENDAWCETLGHQRESLIRRCDCTHTIAECHQHFNQHTAQQYVVFDQQYESFIQSPRSVEQPRKAPTGGQVDHHLADAYLPATPLLVKGIYAAPPDQGIISVSSLQGVECVASVSKHLAISGASVRFPDLSAPCALHGDFLWPAASRIKSAISFGCDTSDT